MIQAVLGLVRWIRQKRHKGDEDDSGNLYMHTIKPPICVIGPFGLPSIIDFGTCSDCVMVPK